MEQQLSQLIKIFLHPGAENSRPQAVAGRSHATLRWEEPEAQACLLHPLLQAY